MTQIIYAVIDNHKEGKRHSWNIIYKSKSFSDIMRFRKEKGLM